MTPADLTKRRMNPLVDRYVTTDLPLLDIARTASSHHPLVRALIHIHECLLGKRLAKEAIASARAVPMKGSDPELMILMLSSWAELSNRIGRPSETEALIHRAKSLVSPDTHAAVRACALFAEALLGDATGNKAAFEAIVREILDLLPAHSPRRKLYLWETALFLSRQGRGVECQSELRELSWQCNERFHVSRILIAQFVNAVETGSVKEASELMPQIATSSHVTRELTRVPYRGYQELLKLMHGPNGERGAGGAERNGALVWVDVARQLLDGNAEAALELARQQADKVLGSIFASGFDSFSLIRSELSAGRAQAARHLIEMRQARGNRHYLDDFFLARAEHLDGNPKSAAARFAGALKSVEYYRARGRLDFELALACELSHGDIVELTRAAERGARKTERGKGRKTREPAADTSPDLAERVALNSIVGRSTATQHMRETVTRFADIDSPILITGETGTGKELIARALHNLSKRGKQPFTAVNCSSMTETLLESELFGYERGAFTGAEKTTQGLFEATGKGTIFLDEIGDISPRLQTALLRVLETEEIRPVGSTKPRKVSCRIIAATNADLPARAATGHFRQDLMFRLQRLVIEIPPLRERPADILPLVRHFLDTGRRVGTHAKLSAPLVEAIKNYDWPGNVRELRNVVERMRLMHSDKLDYNIDDLDIKLQDRPPAAPGESAPPPGPVAEAARPDAGGRLPQADIETFLRGGRSQIRRLDRLRELFAEYKKLTRSEVIRILAVSPNTATKDLKALCDDGTIERIEPSASTRSHYFVLKEDNPPPMSS